MRFARDAAVVLLVVLALAGGDGGGDGGDDGGPPRKRDGTPDDQTPLCQECAKTGKHSPTIRGTEWTRTSR
jgi:hypothetical protein